MISALSGFNLSDYSLRLKYGGQPIGGRQLQPVPGLDQVHVSNKARNLATAGQGAALQVARPAGLQTYLSIQSVDASFPAQPDKPAAGISIEDRVRDAFFTHKGDDGFDATLDFDGDGRINFNDLAALRDGVVAPPGVPAPDDKPVADRVRGGFFSARGDEGFDAGADVNGDGRVNFADLAALRNGTEAPATRPAEPAEPSVTMADRMRKGFFAQGSDERFDAGVDLNGDGRVNFADLAMMRAKQEASDGEPLRPVAPARDDDGVGVRPVNEPGTGEQQRADAARLEALRDSFFANAGSAAFDAGADLNADGRIDFRDLAALRADD